MAQTSTIFLTATDARQNPIRETVIHDEARLIETAVLSSVKIGLYECTVSGGTPMTMSLVQPTDVWTVDPSTSTLYVPNHGLKTGDSVTLSTNGTLPSPLLSTKYYYVIFVDFDHIKLAETFADSVSLRPIAISITSGVSSIEITNNGSGYLQAPIVSFVGGDPTVPATATAYLSDWGSVVAVNNTTSGAGYTDLPTVSIVPQGSGATAGTITFKCVSVTIGAAGQDYRVGDLMSVIGGTGLSSTIRVTDTNLSGGVTAVSIVNGGNYSVLPNVSNAATTVTPGGGQSCTVNLSFGISSIEILTAGTGYISAPRVVIDSNTGVNAEAYATLYGGSLHEIIITNPGYGYLNVDSVLFDAGSGATGQVILNPTTVSSITLTDDGGLTYTETPSVSITSQGSGASVDTIIMKVVNVQLISGGKNYQVGDSLLISGGVTTENAWIRVQSISPTGAILTYTLENGGLYTALPGLNNNPVIGGSGTLASFNLSMGLDSLTVQTGGSGYVVPPVVSISIPPSFGMAAQARAVLTNDAVTSFVVEKAGYGYISIPSVSLSTGANATAVAYLTETTVDTITVNNQGSGYTVAVVTISGGGATVNATATANIVAGQIVSIDVDTAGAGYTGTPNIVINGDGSDASASVELTPTSISYIELTNAGINYTVPPLVTIEGAATAISILTGTGIQNIVIDDVGENYVSDPVVYVIPGVNQVTTPVSPVLRSIRAFSVKNISLTFGGDGYQSVPSVVLSAPFFSVGTTTTASATIGAGSGTFMLIPYLDSRDYFAAWKGQALSNSQLARPYTERMDTVIAYFTNLGYTINRLTNPVTNNTFMWSLQW